MTLVNDPLASLARPTPARRARCCPPAWALVGNLVQALAWALAWVACGLPAAPVLAAPDTLAAPPAAVTPESLQAQVRRLADAAVARLEGLPPGARVVVDVGAPDARLKLAACRRTEPFLPPSARLWGRSRVGVRCVEGERAWQVYVPVAVQVWAQSLVGASALPAGTVLAPEHLARAEVDLAAGSTALREPAQALGRTLARPLTAGAALREADLRARLWFAAGETVTVIAVGPGFRITGSGTALSPGHAGQRVRVRTDQGRILVGQAVGEARVEVGL